MTGSISALLLTRRGEAPHLAPSAQAPLPRRLPSLSSRLHCLLEWRASACTCATLVRGEKSPRSTQARQHRGLSLSQPAMHVLRDHRCPGPCSGRRWKARPQGAHPDPSLPCLPHHVQCPAQHPLVSFENPFPFCRHGALRAGRRIGSFGCRACLRLSTSNHHDLAVPGSPCTLIPCTSASSAICNSHTFSWTNCARGCASPNRCCC